MNPVAIIGVGILAVVALVVSLYLRAPEDDSE